MWGDEDGQAGEGQHTEVEDLDAQFAQQHQAMDHMRQMLAARDHQHAARLRQAQAYATRLSEIKSRARASKRSMSGESTDMEPGDVGGEKKACELPPDPGGQEKEPEKQPGLNKKSDKFRHGNLSLLRKQMEENRIKFEQRGKEMTENKRGVEEMLTQLKKQLDERDQIIRGLQQRTDVISDLDTSDSIAQDTSETTVVAAVQECQQLREELTSRDTTIAQLNAQVQELEGSVFGLQENLREKDSVIEARTKAIALLSEDLSKRSKTTLDTLDETRQQMRLMQQNFVTLEARMKEEKDRLNSDIEARDKRLAESQESIAALETARFDLSTRNAALQEKVVRLQELSVQLREQQEVASQRAEQLVATLDEANKQAVRTKAQYANKMKALKKKLDALSEVTDVNEEIAKLQNRIAELEEEKVSEAELKQRLAGLEEHTQQVNKDEERHLNLIAVLDDEKLEIQQRDQMHRKNIARLVADNEELKDRMTSLENENVMLEMRAVELEEQFDTLSKERTELQAEVVIITQQLSSAVQGQNERLEVTQPAEEVGDHAGKNEKDSSNLEVVLRSLEAELVEARRALDEQKVVISDLNAKLDSKEEDLELQREMILKLEQLTAVDNRTEEENGSRITDILKDIGDVAADLEEWKMRCSEVEDRLKALEMEKMSLETRFEEVCSENRTLGAMLQEQKNMSDQLTDKLKDQSEGICARDANIVKLKTLIEENGLVLKERETALEEVRRVLDEVQGNFKRRYSELEASYQVKQAELEMQKASMQEVENVLVSKDSELKYLKMDLDKREYQLESLMNEHKIMKETLESSFQDKIQELSQQLTQMSCENQQLMQSINDLNNDIIVKNKYIEKLEIGMKNSEEVEKQWQITLDALNKTSSLLDSVKQELGAKSLECSELAQTLTVTEEQNREKIEKMKRLTANLKAKALALRGSEDKVKQLEAAIREKETALSELNEKLADGKNVVRTTELEAMLRNKEKELLHVKSHCEELTRMLHSKEGEVGLLAHEVTDLKRAVEELRHEKSYGENSSALAQTQNEVMVLKVKVDDKEREIELLRAEQGEWLRKCSDAEYKNNKLLLKITELEQKNTSLEVNTSHNTERVAELEEEVETKDFDYVAAMGKVEGLQGVISEQRQQFLESNAKQQDLDMVGRDMKIVELEEQISSIQERYQQTWAASEAKLQEREAVVESLEMELSRSQERVQSLENSVSEMGERQGTLESSLVALERQLEEAGQRLREEEEHRQLTEIELARLVTVEVSSKQRLEELLEKKVELESGMKEGTAERGELLKRIANLEASCRERSSEVERLSEFESAFNEESLQVQVLMLQVRQHAAEMEGKGRDLEESRQYCESLECDLRTCHEQLEEMDADRRNLVEERDKLVSKLRQVEENLTSASDEWEGKLNDQSNQIMQLQKEKEKLSDCLGSKIESIQQSDVDVKVDHVDFQKQISELSMQLTNLKEVMVQKEEEVKTYQTRLLQLQFCGQSQLTEDSETSFRSKISALEVTNTELRERILEYEKNIYNQQEHLAANAEESFQNQILELEVANVEMHGKIAKSEEMISDLHEQQLAGSAKETLQKKIWELEACNAELHGRVIHYQENISDLEEQLSRARVDLEGVYLKLNHNVEETRLLVEKVDLLQGELGMKNVEFQELSCKYQDIAGNSNSRVHMECKSKIAELHCEKNELLKQLLREKAASEVQNIIMLAEEQVRSVASTKEPSTQGRDTIVDESVQVKHVDEVAAVSFEQLPLCILEQTPVVHPEELIEQMSVAPGTLDNMLLYTARIQELEDHLAQLQHKLYTIKEDRDSAVARVKELEVQSKEAEQLAAIVSQPVPVVEEVCVQKSAYLTYQPDELSSMESRDPGDGASPPQEFHNITFFQEQSDSSFSLEVEPAVLEDESWGWGTDEARLEEEHLRQKQVSAPAPAVEVSDRLSSLEAELQALVVKKAAAEEEVNATQARCDKLLHKLKDIKIKNDNLMKENLELSKHNAAASSFGDLDSAIEEEFKIRIKSLEKSMKELMSELDVARLEREGLLKQIDVLTSANSRILEVKEKQDLDLDFCQKRYKEMSNAKEAMEWVLEELTEENKILSSKIGDLESELSSLRAESVSAGTQDENIQGRAQLALQELQEQLVVLAADNEHLQTLLEEQRNLRLKAEAGLSKKHGSSTTADTESRNKADVTCDDLRLENGTMTREVENLSRELVSVQSAYQSLKTRKEEYDRGITTNNSMVTKICDRCDSLQKQYEEVIESLTKEMSEVRRQYETRVKENVELVCWLETARRNLYELRKKCEKMAMKWLCGSVNMEEETIAFLQLRDEVRAAVVQLKISKEITMTSSSTIPAVERVECIISQLRQGLKENVADVESQTEAVAFKNEDIMHLQESVALRDSKLARFEEQVRYPSTWAGGDDGQGTEPLLLAREEELARLKREVDSLRQEATAADERALVKDEDIQSLRVQLAEKSHKLEEAVEARERDVDELRQLVEERDRDEHKLRRLQEEMAALREQSVSPADPETDDQSELDVALYMLHQRDVRCDELTLELMQLLEERDTLQLRLSNALRANEEQRSKVKSISSTPDPVGESADTVENCASQDQEIGEPVEENREDLQQLDTKLSQLRSVGYRRDITFQDEQQHRHSAQMKLLQRRSSGIVVDANYTLSRDVQPPSTVLLNWIRGRSTPRVMHV